MSFSLAGLGISALVAVVILSPQSLNQKLLSLFTINLIYEGFINLGYWAIIGSQTFKVSDFLQIITLMYAILVFLNYGFPTKLFFFTGCIITSVLLLKISPFSEPVRAFNALDMNADVYDIMHYVSLDVQCIKTTLRLICFAWNACAVYMCISEEDWNYIRYKYFRFGRLVIIYAWFEFIVKNVFHQGTLLHNLMHIIFSASETNVADLSRNGLYVIVGLTNEPSQFTMVLFSYWLVYIIGKEWENQVGKTRWITYSSFALMMLSGSFRIVGMLPILLFMYMVVSEKPTSSVIIVAVGGIVLVLLKSIGVLDYYFNRLGNVFSFMSSLDSTNMTGGEAGRLNTVVQAFRVWLKKPWFGIGPGQTFAYGFIPSILAMTGIFGLVSWYNLIFGYVAGIRIGEKANILVLAFSFAWIYTDSIAIGYSIYVLAMALEFRRMRNIVYFE